MLSLKIFLFSHSDIDDLIKDTFLFLTHLTSTLNWAPKWFTLNDTNFLFFPTPATWTFIIVPGVFYWMMRLGSGKKLLGLLHVPLPAMFLNFTMTRCYGSSMIAGRNKEDDYDEEDEEGRRCIERNM